MPRLLADGRSLGAVADHVVQFYRDAASLQHVASEWLAEALSAGGGILLAATPANAALLRQGLRARGLDDDALAREGRLVVLDADDLMSQFMTSRGPSGAHFRRLVRTQIQALRARLPPGAPVRAWGEMVDLLCKRGDAASARQLEGLWNELIEADGIELLCSYELDHLDPAVRAGSILAICHDHGRMIGPHPPHVLGTAVDRALSDVFGDDDARALRRLLPARRGLLQRMDAAEATLLSLRDLDAAVGDKVLARTRAHLTTLLAL